MLRSFLSNGTIVSPNEQKSKKPHVKSEVSKLKKLFFATASVPALGQRPG